MPLPSEHPMEKETKPSFQLLDRIWAHNNPGEFHTEAMSDHDRRQVCAAYYAMISLIDDQVGRILQALDESGQTENTLVIFMSDHGEMLGDHGIYFKGPHFYDCQLRIPLVMRWPAGGIVAENRRIEGLIELVDLAPTFLDAAGIDIPGRCREKSIVITSGRPRGGVLPRSGLLRILQFMDSWRCLRHDASHKDEKIVVFHGTQQGEFYDLRNDPEEFFNLVG